MESVCTKEKSLLTPWFRVWAADSFFSVLVFCLRGVLLAPWYLSPIPSLFPSPPALPSPSLSYLSPTAQRRFFVFSLSPPSFPFFFLLILFSFCGSFTFFLVFYCSYRLGGWLSLSLCLSFSFYLSLPLPVHRHLCPLPFLPHSPFSRSSR